MPTFKRTNCQYYLGDVNTNYGVLARPGFAVYEVPEQRFGAYTLEDVECSPLVHGVTLAATALQPATLAQFSVNPPDALQIWTPPNQPVAHAFAYRAEAVPVEISSVGALPGEPSFTFSFTRAPQPPAGMPPAEQVWRLTFADFTLEWGRTGFPRLYRNDVLLEERLLPESALRAFNSAAALAITVQNLFGDLFICCALWPEPWVVRGVGAVPSAPYGMQCSGGQFSFNLSPFTFATSGAFVTDWIEHGVAYPDTDLLVDVFPPDQPAGTGVAVTVAEYCGTAKRYRVTLTGDGAHTPVVQAFQYRYHPQVAIGDRYWREITQWVTGATVTCAADPGAACRVGPTLRHAELSLVPQQRVNGKTLWEWVGGLHGAYAFRMQVGAVYVDEHGMEFTDQLDRLHGIVQIADDVQAIAAVDRLTLAVPDRWEQLSQTALLFAPSVAGMRVDAAIALIAQWAGISPTQIDAAPVPYWLCEPAGDYTRPTWFPPNGTRAGDFIRKIAERYGAVVEFDGAGVLVVRPGLSTDSVATYTLDEGGDPIISLERVEEREDRAACVNTVIVEGRGANGLALFAMQADAESLTLPGSLRYVGYPVIEYITDPDLTTQEAVNIACAQHFANRRAALPQRLLQSCTSELWKRVPNEVVTLINHRGSGVERVRLLLVRTQYRPLTYTTTARGEVLP